MIGVLNAAIAAGYYLRVVGVLYFQSSETEPQADPVLGNAGAGLTALVAALLVIGAGLLTGPVMSAAQSAAAGLWPEAATARMVDDPASPRHSLTAINVSGISVDHDAIVEVSRR